MASFADVERLRQQNVSLLKRLQENQHELRHSVQSTKGFDSASSISTPVKEHSFLQDSNNDGRYTKHAPNSVHITSTPKQLPMRTHASPTHRSRTELLDTTPQEFLSNSISFDADHFLRHSSRLETGHDQRLHTARHSRSSKKRRKLNTPQQRKQIEKGVLSKPRRSPRNISFVSTPRQRLPRSKILNSAKSRHQVQNRLNLGVGKSTTTQMPLSFALLERSPSHGRYNMRRPDNSAMTPVRRSSQKHNEQNEERTPKQYHSQFLNSYYSNEPKENVEKVKVQKSRYSERMLDDGNARSQSRRVLDTTSRPKSILLTPANKSCKAKNSMRVSFRASPNSSSTSMIHSGPDSSRHVQPLLGYDWIAGLLDMDDQASELSEAYLAELQEFRRTNYDDCVHKSFSEQSGTAPNTSHQSSQLVADTDQVPEITHKCIHNYTLNDRLFPVPLHGTESGESLCAICNSRRKLDSSTVSPAYIRVSVPRSTLRSPYQVRPHRRNSFDPTDSVGLSQHCLAGWENSLPSMMPAASNLDLKDSLGYTLSKSQGLFMDKEDATGQPSRSRRPLVPSTETQQLLNRSRSLGLELQRLERAGLSQARSANSTQYPVL